MNRRRLAACVAICATLLVSGCASGTATITGALVGADGACLYVDVPGANGTDRYWLRQLPAGYVADETGLSEPGGSHIGMGDRLTVTGGLSWAPLERNCENAHTLDVTVID
ncbi:MAG: hypothetical protein ACRDGL_08370 [Candidatus Limnocylindrales bacterium]